MKVPRRPRPARSAPPIRVGVFPDVPAADAAVHGLVDAGFPKETISVICPSCEPTDFPGVERQAPAGSHTPEAAASGGAIGALLGGFAAGAGAAATGGTGLLFAGPLLAGAATGGLVGGFVGAMTTRGMEPEIADYYDQALRKGRILVAVEPSKESPAPAKAEQVLERAGAEPVELRRG